MNATIPSTAKVETQLIKFSDELDPKKVERFLSRERINTRKAVAKGNAGQRKFRDFAGWTEEQIEECVQFMFRSYRHTLRKEIVVK